MGELAGGLVVLYSKSYVGNYSRFLIALAWTVEVIAVLIGLTISIVVALSAYDSIASESNVSLLDGTSAIAVAALPFVLIAVVEICKIPLTFAFMSVRNVAWRVMFLLFVLFLCLITFETMLNGFERNFSNLNRAIDSRKNEIESAESEIALLENRRDHVVRFTEDELLGEVEVDRAEIDTEYRQVVQRIDANTRDVLADIDYGFKPELEQEIVRLETVRDELLPRLAGRNRGRGGSLLDPTARQHQRQLQRARTAARRTRRLKTEFAAAMATANVFTRGGRGAQVP